MFKMRVDQRGPAKQNIAIIGYQQRIMRKMLLFANTFHPHQTVMEFGLPVESQGARHPTLVYMLGVPAIKLIFKVRKASLV